VTLYRVKSRFDSCCLKVDGLIKSGITYSISDKIAFETHVLYAVIKLHDYWCSSCRQLLVLSCAGGNSTASGVVLPRAANLPPGEEPVTWLRRNWTAKKMSNSWEPDWHIPFQCMRAAKLLGVANYTTVIDALGALTLIDHLRIIRNTIVHSLPVTYLPYRKLLSSGGHYKNTDIVNYVLGRDVGTSQFVIHTWIDELQLCLAAAVR